MQDNKFSKVDVAVVRHTAIRWSDAVGKIEEEEIFETHTMIITVTVCSH